MSRASIWMLAPFLVGGCLPEKEEGIPSGFDYRLQEELSDVMPDGQRVLRLRYVAEQIGSEGGAYEAVSDDFAVLCMRDALQRAQSASDPFAQVVVSLSSKESKFGVFDPNVIQYFEAFTVQNNTCILEAF